MLLVIMRQRTRKKITLALKVLVAVVVISLVVSHLYNVYQGKNVIKEGWLRDDKPSGNPMRVENITKKEYKSDPDIFNQFVVKLRDFYHKND